MLYQNDATCDHSHHEVAQEDDRLTFVFANTADLRDLHRDNPRSVQRRWLFRWRCSKIPLTCLSPIDPQLKLQLATLCQAMLQKISISMS